MKPIVSIVFVYFNTPKEIVDAVASLPRALGELVYEIIIVDNASTRPLPKSIIKNRIVRVIRNKKNIGYGRGVNAASSVARGEYLLIANPDVLFEKKAIENMIRRARRDKHIGVIGPQMRDKSGNILPTISEMPFLPGAIVAFSFLNTLFPHRYWLYKKDRSREQVVDVVSGACMLIRKSLFETIGGFDERFFLYFEEADFCYRIQKKGKKILYYPQAKIIHYIGRSNSNKAWIKRIYEQNRYSFFKKYHGFLSALIGEILLRFLQVPMLLLFATLLVSAFLNLYKIQDLMMFIGDFGRDYLAAAEMLATGNIPLVGIPSSVVWLHQGPLSIYFIAFSLFVGRFHPVAPALFYGMLGVASTYLVYRLGKEYFSAKVGLLSSLFYATSPLVVVSARMPYHTSAIPFFAGLFFLLLYKVLQGKTHLLFVMFFLLGLLFQLELSNGVLFFLLAILGLLFRQRIKRSEIMKGMLGFSLGILPFILYDLTHSFKQTVGFTLWVANRIRLFFGLTLSGQSTTVYAPGALQTIWEQIVRLLFPAFPFFVVILLCIMLVILLRRRKVLPLTLVLLWITIPLFGFFIHAAPGTAYFPLVFPPIAILIGYAFYRLIREIKIVTLLFIVIIFINASFTIKHNYFLGTQRSSGVTVAGWSYGLGPSLSEQMKIVDFILSDAKRRPMQLKGGGFLSEFQTSIDNYKYLVLWKGGRLDTTSRLVYIIYADKREIPESETVVFSNNIHYVTKYEKR